ncbi:thiol:disulfide interchange protein DsbG [Marinospirillum insulare]|uniref:Thiol:disulfide interchange protein n=1 Tax=Marinospirillum insulare TaxID=217169 RepID=A0ABQ5ZYD2_9GAMM|nr:thiol:disulfide interchange protein DsbG [Marinospirillum insulare]GLR64035.1 thiol:disulfide interchange protein DsbG [Marinospirillum insulare]
MTRHLFLTLLALTFSLLLSLSSYTLAENTPAQNTPSQPAETQLELEVLPAPIQHLKNKGLVIVREFPVGAALKGWVVNYQGKDMIVYTTADDEFLINGVLLDAQGNDLTEGHQKSWIPRPSWDDLATSHFITEPSLAPESTAGESTIYMFYDANCPFCHLAWLALQPYREAGLEVRWIPVAYLKPDSRDKAAAILSTPKNKQAEHLRASMQAFNTDTQDFSQPPSNENKQQLQTNMNLMQSLGINGTPGWVWLNKEGKMQTQAGMLRLPKLPNVTGLPAQKHTEPTLMRFR